MTSTEVEDWLKTLALAPSSRAKIRTLMSTVFRGWIGQNENPDCHGPVRGKASQCARDANRPEFRSLFAGLPSRERAIGAICATTGFRICSARLKWEDIDFIERSANVLRSYVDGAIGPCKTEISQQPVPLDDLVIDGLLAWRIVCCPYSSDEEWIFGSETLFGKLPLWPDSLRAKILQPSARRAGITKRVGWHTFRHTYSTLLKANNEDVKVVQELMRHATSHQP